MYSDTYCDEDGTRQLYYIEQDEMYETDISALKKTNPLPILSPYEMEILEKCNKEEPEEVLHSNSPYFTKREMYELKYWRKFWKDTEKRERVLANFEIVQMYDQIRAALCTDTRHLLKMIIGDAVSVL